MCWCTYSGPGVGKTYTCSSQRQQIDIVKNPKNIKTVILGIGNILLGDEGIGVYIVKRLHKEKLPHGVILVDGSTAGFRLFSIFEAYRKSRFIIIDAVKPEDTSTGTPRNKKKKNTSSNGGLFVIPLDDFYNIGSPEYLSRDFISFHQTSLVDVLNLFYLAYRIKIRGYLIGIDISGSMDNGLSFSMKLTGRIKQKIPKIIELVKKYTNS